MTTRTARLHLLRQIITGSQIKSQAELVAALHNEGIAVTQATLSRDLDLLGASKVHANDGHVFYAIKEDSMGERTDAGKEFSRLGKTLNELMASAQASANIVVVRTPPGAASYLASALDRSGFPGVLGTIAGDDTVMVISTDAEGGSQVCRDLIELASK